MGRDSQRRRLAGRKVEQAYHVGCNCSIFGDGHLGLAPFLRIPNDVAVQWKKTKADARYLISTEFARTVQFTRLTGN